MLSVDVHAANIHDTKSGISTAKEAYTNYPSIQKFCADAGYRGTFVSDVKERLGLGVDISEGMMAIGHKKVSQQQLEHIISFQKEDCLNLSFEDNTFDAVTAAFGIRNFQNLDQGLKEMCRVLKKGGHLSIVELTEPVSFPMHQLFRIYSHTFLPLYGKMLSKDDSAYSYLTATIEAFPEGEEMMGIFKKAGFTKVSFKRLTFGICTMYFATK